MQKEKYKRMISILLLLGLFFGLRPVGSASAAVFARGSGTSAEPWIIETPAQLAALRDFQGEAGVGKYFRLGRDIPLDDYLSKGSGHNGGKGWIPIGTESSPFKGTMDGDGHVVSGLWVKDSALEDSGLFGYASGAVFRNLHVELDNKKGLDSRRFMAPLAGFIRESEVSGCSGKGVLRPTGTLGLRLGGLVGGAVLDSSIRECYATGQIVSEMDSGYIGGLVGWLYMGTVLERCYANVEISMKGDSHFTGGFCGYAINCTMSDCYAQGSVTEEGDENHTGGFAGEMRVDVNGIPVYEMKNCYATGRVRSTGQKTRTGGFAGFDNYVIRCTGCFYNKTTTGQTGESYQGDREGCVGKTTAELMRKSTFTTGTNVWDFSSVWSIEEGKDYPRLLWSTPSAVTLNTASVDLILGKTTTLKATVVPANAVYTKVGWTSEHTSVATVSANGLVTGKNTGTTNIRATAGGKSALAKVTVHSYVSMRIGKKNAVRNGVKTTIDDSGTAPFTLSGKTMVPMRFVGEKMGGKVSYISDKKPIVMSYGNKTTECLLGSKTMTVKTDGKVTGKVTLEVAPRKKGGRTFIPLRAVSQALGFAVHYENSGKYIVVNNPKMSSDILSQRLAEARKLIG